jgi:hypothetical protein
MKIKRFIKYRFASYLGRPATHRRFIDHSLGVCGFLNTLKERDVSYVVLRWFEELPEVAPGEDVDILVSDEDVETLTSCVSVNRRRKDIPCDIYSVSGLPGTSSREMPYYPVPVAQQILRNAVWMNGIVRVPAPDEHFLSMCYHAVYHKGYASGIPSNVRELNDKVVVSKDHDYVKVIKRLYEQSSFHFDDFEVTLEGIDEVLSQVGWKPANDTLEKLSKRNRWIHDVLLSQTMDIPEYMRGLAVFLVREKGIEYLSLLRKSLFDLGFDHLLEGAIPPERVESVAAGIRGGNWGKGPWPTSGGLPVHYFVVFDSKPLVPSAATREAHVGLDNDRIPAAKLKLRDLYNEGRSASEQCNIIHSTDNGSQSIDYLELINPECLSYVEQEAKRKSVAFSTPFEVIEDLSKHARRAKVELIDFHGRKAICKTFKEGREHYLQREVVAREVGKELSEISDILEVGGNYIVMEFYDDSIDRISTLRPLLHGNGYLPIWAIERMKNIILYYRSRGYECVDFNPHNVLFDPHNGLKVIDFEFLQKTENSSGDLVGNYAWYTAPAGVSGDFPKIKYSGSLYNKRWFKYTGLPLFFCIHEFPVPVLHVVRAKTYCYFSVKNAGRKFLSLSPKRFIFR